MEGAMNASFEEKTVWVSLLSMLAVLGLYFVVAARMLAAGITNVVPFVPVFILAVVMLVIIQVVGIVVVAVLSRPDGRDERDRLISWRAEHNSSWLLGVGAVVAIFALALPVGRVWIAHGLLLALFVSEVASHALRLYYYRRGI
jgi:hypothetical protein